MKIYILALIGSLLALPAAAQIKNGPEGIVCLTVNPLSLSQLTNDPGWTNPNVAGFLIREPWKVIEPSQGVYNFVIFQKAVMLGAKYSKFVGLSIGAGANSPTWIYTAGVQQFPFITTKNKPPKIMPAPWDPIFQELWNEMVAEFGDMFDGNSSVAYVVMTGPGRDYETDFVTAPTDVASFESSGEEVLWQEAATQIAQTYVASFPHTHLIYAMAPPTPDAAGSAAISSVVSNLFLGYPSQFGVACASLAPTTLSTTLSVGFIQSQSPYSTVGFQMAGKATSIATNTGKGATPESVLAASFAKAILYQAHYVEVYTSDCSTAAQQTNLQTADAALISISTASGSP